MVMTNSDATQNMEAVLAEALHRGTRHEVEGPSGTCGQCGVNARRALSTVRGLIHDAYRDAQRAVSDIEWGAGSEHFRHGRETMQADALQAIGRLKEAERTAAHD